MANQVLDRQVMPHRLRRWLLAVLWATALAAPVGAIGYLLYANLYNPRATALLTGTYDGFYWDAAQLQIAYARLENQLLLYRNGSDLDYPRLQLRYEVLQSKLHVMAGSTQTLTEQMALLQRQQDEIRTLESVLDTLEPDFEEVPQDPRHIDRIVTALRDHWQEVNDIALSRRFADVADREAISRDFIDKRRMLFAAGVMLLMLSTAATLLLVVNGRRRSRLIRQQRAALDAEHQASQAAREASLAKDAFLGMISHELRTPLHAIVSSIELLGFNFQSEADRKVIQRLESAARHLEAQMRDLTDYARLGAGKLELRYEQFDPRELLASIIDEHTPAAQARGLTLASEATGLSGPVDSDPHRIRQIVSNLVTNAIRYTEKGSVRVRLAQRLAVLTIAVSDTGPGVPPGQLPLMFKEFTQLDGSRTRRFEGAGMGLAIVQGLLKLFGGSVAVESKVGEGTTFTVTIPVGPVEPAETPGARPPHVSDDLHSQVLVVDDNASIRESLCEMIMHMGYGAVAVGSAHEALDWLDMRRCDAVLLDLHMPDQDGYTFFSEFASRSGPSAGVPVIAISAYAPEAPPTGTSPFFEYLVKPVHYEDLRGVLQRALAARSTV
ncbi:ATP-binding protein [Paraburkholderia sp. DHOC27]|uniref:ATP-binding response regulator n=1 Tax=Paraburkholderia sp. DHOC27 TaxID=2303330 RepID=UPI000E3E4527|nr:ATP-binding protein [Paraburkholderia sp. DHOC27]RFU44113.1 response regulator [Paraburkholderia sp. DHOC27]